MLGMIVFLLSGHQATTNSRLGDDAVFDDGNSKCPAEVTMRETLG